LTVKTSVLPAVVSVAVPGPDTKSAVVEKKPVA
jgi:hypothetical protein